MRREAPLILGAGPAGSTAAIMLAQAGAVPTLLDRDEQVGDALCGGFLSWRTAERMRAVGIGPMQLGAHPVTKLALLAGRREAIVPLPSPGFGLSRQTLDTALRRQAVAAGVRLVIDRARAVRQGMVTGESGEWPAETIFLATGKHDVRGSARPRDDADPALGLRMRIPPDDRLIALLKGRIELHMFRGGYAGIVLQEGGSANICLAVRKSMLTEAAGNPRSLLGRLADAHPRFGERLVFAASDATIDTVGSVPYGWIARTTEAGVWRLGDQAAVIPSLAGEGMAIAMESGAAAARGWLAGHDANRFQTEFAKRVERPVHVAKLVWRIGEMDPGARLLTAMARGMPALANAVMNLTRI